MKSLVLCLISCTSICFVICNQFLHSFIGLKDLASETVFCGGALVNPRYAITAAHCLSTWNNVLNTWIMRNIRSFVIVSKEANKSSIDYIPGIATTCSEGYGNLSRNFIANDLGIVKLEENYITPKLPPITLFSDDNQAIIKSLDNMIRTGFQCSIYTWHTNDSGIFQESAAGQIILLNVCIEIICQWAPRICEYANKFGELLCVIVEDPMLSSHCKDTSIGPLVCDGRLWGMRGWDTICENSSNVFVYSGPVFMRHFMEGHTSLSGSAIKDHFNNLAIVFTLVTYSLL